MSRHGYWWNRRGTAACECGEGLAVTLGRTPTPPSVRAAGEAHAAHAAVTVQGENRKEQDRG